MRILHTADWHLGRIFQGVSLVEDQAYTLRSLVEHIRETQPDVVVIAGDVYDRAVPPPDAVALLDDVLSEISLGLRVPILCIAGNHDSPDRLQIWGKMLQEHGVHVVGRIERSSPISLVDEWGLVSFHLLPFAEPGTIKEVLRRAFLLKNDGDLTSLQKNFLERVGKSHGTALQAHIQDEAHRIPKNTRAILVAHGSVDGSAESESERSLWNKAGHAVDPQVLQPFSYTALGHHHAPQTVVEGRVRYSGSLLPYSFSEADQEKSVTLIDVNEEGSVSLETLPLAIRHLVRVEEGSLHSLLHKAKKTRSTDYLKVILDDNDAPVDPVGQLKPYWPNLLVIERRREKAWVQNHEKENVRIRRDSEKLSTVELLNDFFNEVQSPLSKKDEAFLLRVIQETEEVERGQ
ncbi:MAG: exonuclease SbcCD subunit D [Deltaproteobacteria bacterium]|nr:exonuclease SbcCD subunit D [Deltaproteobacteria bacterium]